MRMEQREWLLLTFASTAAAMAMEQLCRERQSQ